MAELLEIEDALLPTDWMYVESMFFYPTAKSYAKKKIAAFVKESGLYPTEDALS